MGALKVGDYAAVLSMLGMVLLYIDRWVHERNATEDGLKIKIDGPASIRAQLEAAEVLRIERAAQVNDKIHDLHLRIERLHQAASDEGDRQQVLYLAMSERVAKLEADLRAVFSIIDRRDPTPPRSMP